MGLLIISLILLLLLSAFFSCAETAMMAINRYRLRHLVRKKHRTAKCVYTLLKRPDRLLGIVLIGNTFANVFAAAIATLIATRLLGEPGVAIATLLLTFIILIFAEITPKTLAALYPQKVAFAAAWPLKWLLQILYPIIWLVNNLANGLLQLFHVNINKQEIESLTGEELRTVVNEAVGKISPGYQEMLLSILDLGKTKVEHIMIPRHEIVGIDFNDSLENILALLRETSFTRLPIYREDINQAIGVLHVRKALNLLAHEQLNKTTLLNNIEEVYFVPEGTQLNVQLANFKLNKCRMGFVVDEYGDVQGLITLEDILEEIVGEFTTTDLALENPDIHQNKDGSYLVDGRVTVRELNRMIGLSLPLDGPVTLNGLIIEHLENLPQALAGIRIAGCPMEIIKIKNNAIKLVKILAQSCLKSTP